MDKNNSCCLSGSAKGDIELLFDQRNRLQDGKKRSRRSRPVKQASTKLQVNKQMLVDKCSTDESSYWSFQYSIFISRVQEELSHFSTFRNETMDALLIRLLHFWADTTVDGIVASSRHAVLISASYFFGHDAEIIDALLDHFLSVVSEKMDCGEIEVAKVWIYTCELLPVIARGSQSMFRLVDEIKRCGKLLQRTSFEDVAMSGGHDLRRPLNSCSYFTSSRVRMSNADGSRNEREVCVKEAMQLVVD